MPIYVKVKDIIGKGDELTPEQEEKLKSIPIVDEDKVNIQVILTDIIVDIEKSIQQEQDRTKALNKSIFNYLQDLSNDIEPQVQQKRVIIDSTIKSQDTEIQKLQAELKDVSAQLEARRQNAENYDNMLYVSMLGGLIGVAIEQTIFGDDAAENERIKNELEARVKEIINSKKEKDMLRSQIELLGNGFRNTCDRLNSATCALGHLNEVWKRTRIQIKESLDSVKGLKNLNDLVLLKRNIGKIYKPWIDVKQYAEQIVTAFDKAIEVYNRKFR